jgi:adenylate cyclase
VAKLQDFISELKRRRVIRALVGWGIFAFAILQVYEPLMHGLHLPEWTLSLVILVLAGGFPVTVMLAWIFDLRTTGIERTEPTGGTPTRARLTVLLLGLGVLTAVPGLAWYFLGRNASQRPAAGRPSGATPSVAVLPFANLSGDAAQDYFADGMTEEITGKLSRLKGLSVAAGSSVARYRKSPAGPREIGAELQVAHVLEGSVRRSGDRIRVTARLVKTSDAFRVWSEDFDATLDDIFDVQERVATRIVEALGVHLAPEESRSLASWGTRNAAAYDEFLRGMAQAEHFDDRVKLEAGRQHFERALAIDASFAPALAGMADVEVQLNRNFDGDPARLVRAEAAATRALAIDPRLSHARSILASVKANRFDYVGAVDEMRRVVGEDPRSYLAWDRLCWVLGYVEPPRAVEAEQACRKSLEINPGYGEAYYHLVRALALQGREADATKALAALQEGPTTTNLVGLARFWIALASGRPKDALDALQVDKGFRTTQLSPAWAAMAYAQLGENDSALKALELALSRGYRDVPSLRGSRWFEPLRKDPRFTSLLARYGVPGS